MSKYKNYYVGLVSEVSGEDFYEIRMSSGCPLVSKHFVNRFPSVDDALLVLYKIRKEGVAAISREKGGAE